MKKEQLRKALRSVLTDATTGPRLTRFLTRLKADTDQGGSVRHEWCEFWVNICDNWSDAENISEDSPECYHLIMEDLLDTADAWDREKEFAGSLWDVAQCLGM